MYCYTFDAWYLGVFNVLCLVFKMSSDIVYLFVIDLESVKRFATRQEIMGWITPWEVCRDFSYKRVFRVKIAS